MIICNDIGFVHIPKTAGSSIRKALITSRKCYYIAKVISPDKDIRDNNNRHDAHLNPKEISNVISTLRLFTCVRNPWDRLVSWYAFRKEERFRKFPDFVRQLYGVDPEVVMDNERSSLQTAKAVSLQGSYLESISFDFVMRMESLEVDWKVIQEWLGSPVPLPRINTSSHLHYLTFDWSNGLKELVAERESYMINRFGYKFGE